MELHSWVSWCDCQWGEMQSHHTIITLMLPFLHLSEAQNIHHFRLKLNLVRNNFSLYCVELKTYWNDPLRKFPSLYRCVFQTVSASLGNETIFIIIIKQLSVDFKLRKLLSEWLNTSANTITPSKFNTQKNHMLEQVHRIIE